MCRLFAQLSKEDVSSRYYLVDAQNSLRSQAKANPHGWGIGYYSSGIPHIMKKPEDATHSTDFVDRASHVRASTLISHIRYASVGSTVHENTHPFLHDHWIFAHNGKVDTTFMEKNLSSRHARLLHGQTDSEKYFHWIMQNVEQSSDVVSGIIKAVNEIDAHKEDSTSINFLLTNGVALYGLRMSYHRQDHYSLYYARRSNRVVVSSEPIGKGEWTPFVSRELMIATPDSLEMIRL